jgi:hypothetical protein
LSRSRWSRAWSPCGWPSRSGPGGSRCRRAQGNRKWWRYFQLARPIKNSMVNTVYMALRMACHSCYLILSVLHRYNITSTTKPQLCIHPFFYYPPHKVHLNIRISIFFMQWYYNIFQN